MDARRWIAAALALVTLIVYLPVRNHEFIDYDDPCYVSENPLIQRGITGEGLRFAFGQLHGRDTYWHPLTWVSHMLDCELFGVEPGAHHLLNVVFHLANVVLLFGWLERLTRRVWASAAVAMLFAWHPLAVDTVAWVAERKNLLSAMFWILSLSAYTAYAQHGRRRHYCTALALFAAGLLCKPAIVTLPCVLLLLDFWPLNRITLSPADFPKKGGRLLLEKAPFFALTLASCLITIQAHRGLGMIAADGGAPLAMRAGNSVVAYARYLANVAWPTHLSVVYPYRAGWPTAVVVGSVGVLAIGTVLALFQVRARPYLLVGWLWFLGTLVPTIGIVQAGHQAMADRFAYLPVIGIYLALVWWMTDLVARWPRPGRVLGLLAACVGGLCLTATARQITHWKDSRTVFEHAVQVTKDNWVAHNGLGNEAIRRKDYAAAIEQLTIADRLSPDNQHVMYYFGLTYGSQARYAEAEERYGRTLRLNPRHARAWNDLGFIRMRQGRLEEAVNHLQQALRLEPDLAQAQSSLRAIQSGEAEVFRAPNEVLAKLVGDPRNVALRLRAAELLEAAGRGEEAAAQYEMILAQQAEEPRALAGLAGLRTHAGRGAEAIALLERALVADPKSVAARARLGAVCEQAGRTAEALAHYQAAVGVQPDFADGWTRLGWLSARLGNMPEALAAFLRATALEPDNADLQMRTGLVAATLQRAEVAGRALREAARLRPDWPPPLNALAWLLATHPEPPARNGAAAVTLARRACELTGFENPVYLDVLAAALAEAGDFAAAAKTEKKAIAVAKSSATPAPAGLEARLQLFQARRPYHQPPVGGAGP